MYVSRENRQQLLNPDGIPVGQVKFLDEFDAPQICRNFRANEAGLCCWSPDGQYFAWSCGFRIVKIIPWTKYRNWKSAETRNIGRTTDFSEAVIIDAGELVRSIAFGSKSVNDKRRLTRRRSFHFLVLNDVILVTGLCNGRIRTWDVRNGTLLGELIDHAASVSDLSFAPTGVLRLLSASMDGCLKLWDMADDGNLVKTLLTKSKSVFGCCWSPNGKMAVSVGDCRSVLLWDMEAFRIIRSLFGHQHNVCKCSFSPDGALLVTCSFDTCVIIWNVADGIALQKLHHLLPPPSIIFAGGSNGCYVRCVSFSSDGGHLSTVCDDGFVRLWDLSYPNFPMQASSVNVGVSCQFSPDGTVLAVGTTQGRAVMWHSSVEIPSLQHICRISIQRQFPQQSIDDLCLLLPQRLQRYLKYDLF